MKKILTVVFSLFLFPAAALASTNISDDFRDHYASNASNLSAYNKDINTLIGLNDFHTGKATSFPGFDVGATFGGVKVGKDNNISSEDYLITPFITAETFVPVINTTVAVRGSAFNGFESLGLGLKYNYDVMQLFDVTLAGFYDHAQTDWYTVDHLSLSAVASTTVLFVTPYLGVGYDYGDFSTRKMAENRSTSDGAVRYTAGVRVAPFPLFYIFGSYTKTASNEGFQGGIGLNF